MNISSEICIWKSVADVCEKKNISLKSIPGSTPLLCNTYDTFVCKIVKPFYKDGEILVSAHSYSDSTICYSHQISS